MGLTTTGLDCFLQMENNSRKPKRKRKSVEDFVRTENLNVILTLAQDEMEGYNNEDAWAFFMKKLGDTLTRPDGLGTSLGTSSVATSSLLSSERRENHGKIGGVSKSNS